MGAELVHARLPKRARVVGERLTKKTEPEGARAGAIRSAPFGSKVGSPVISHPRARTRWLTERIASPSKARPVFRFKTTKTRVRVRMAKRLEKLRQNRLRKKSDNNVFFRLIRALMADPFTVVQDV